VAACCFSFVTTGQWVNFEEHAFGLGFPWNLWYAALGR
jgi:hypothetical protein